MGCFHKCTGWKEAKWPGLCPCLFQWRFTWLWPLLSDLYTTGSIYSCNKIQNKSSTNGHARFRVTNYFLSSLPVERKEIDKNEVLWLHRLSQCNWFNIINTTLKLNHQSKKIFFFSITKEILPGYLKCICRWCKGFFFAKRFHAWLSGIFTDH